MPEPETPRNLPAKFKFQNAVVIMASRLFYRAEYVAREKQTPEVWVDPDAVGWWRTSDELPPDGAPIIGVVMR